MSNKIELSGELRSRLLNQIDNKISKLSKEFITDKFFDYKKMIYLNKRGDYEELLNNVCRRTSRLMTEASKTIFESIYNDLTKQTLSLELFNDSTNQRIFYRKDIRSILLDKFDLLNLEDIDYKSSYSKVASLGAAGIVFVGGSIVAVGLSSFSVVPLAAILAGLLGYSVKEVYDNFEYNQAVKNYLHNVKWIIEHWIDTIVFNYNECLNEVIASIKDPSYY